MIEALQLPAKTTRWVARRKAEVVAAVRSGAITIEDACARYSLSADELLGWMNALDRHGKPGLRATRLQAYRHLEAESAR